MPRKSPGAKAKGLGRQLRILRTEAAVTLVEAARALGLSKQVISRLETGQRNITPEEVAGLLALYGVTGAKREHLLSMARTLDEPGWWEMSGGVTEESATLIDYEEHAERITNWAPLLIPGLLQTMEYSRAFMLEDGVRRDQVEARLTARLRRQHRLERDDVSYLALIGEPALCAHDQVQRDQLAALVRAAERPNITIRIVPTAAIPRQARLGGFIMVESPPVVHVELSRGGNFLDEPLMIGPYQRILSRLHEVALGETESLRMLSDQRDKTEC